MRSPKLRLAMRVQAGGGEQRREGRGGEGAPSSPGPAHPGQIEKQLINQLP